jgi:hypothetical protein
MTRGTDFYFKMDWDGVWSLTRQYKPLLIFVCLPYASHSPHHERKALLLAEFRRFMLRDELQEVVPEVQRWNFLRKLLKHAWTLQGMPGGLVRPVLQARWA